MSSKIQFVDTDTRTLVDAMISAYEAFTGRTLFPADPARLFILWMADIMIGERVQINKAANQNLLSGADGENLDRMAGLFKDVVRNEAQPARTTFRFWISAPQPGNVMIPMGTRVKVDGDITFETTSHTYIAPGQTSAEAPAVCQIPGTIGNGFLIGQITRLVDVFPFFQAVHNVSDSAGGAGRETDEDFYERIRQSLESYSTAGPTGAYEYFAKKASVLVADARATTPAPGEVNVRILLKNGELPGTEIINLVHETLSSDKVRPMTDLVSVSAPGTVNFNIDLTYYITAPNAASASVLAGAVQDAVDQYVLWQTQKMGRDINPSQLTGLLMKTGIKRVDVAAPVFTQVADNFVARLGTRVINDGGVENE